MILAVQAYGALYTALLLIFCFVTVHVFKLACIGYRARRRLPPEKPVREENAPPPEPVYYIVEKKKKRARAEYSEPKRISFKD